MPRERAEAQVVGGQPVRKAAREDYGEGGIRTPGAVARTPHFECGSFSHSDTSPGGRSIILHGVSRDRIVDFSMRLLKTAFHRSLLKEAAGIRLRERPGDQVHRSIRFVFDFSRFPSYPPSELGRLFALLVAQAEVDGATRMRFCCGTSQMFYTVEGVDYDMVPPSPMAMADMMRLVFQSCRRSAMDAGTLRVR